MAYKFVDNYREKGARKKLVSILRDERKVDDKDVLDAIGKVPRHFSLMKLFGRRLIRILPSR